MMNRETLQTTIEQAWEARATLSPATGGAVRAAVDQAIEQLDNGQLCVVEKTPPHYPVNQWVKQAILLSFLLSAPRRIPGGIGGSHWFDKIASKFEDWGDDHFAAGGFRAVPGSVVRRGAHIAPNVVLMPCFINIGASVGRGTMVDSWATVGSCAQIGARCHLSGGVGIGGVLEPLQASPVIIEDDVFIGARSEVVEGVIIETGAVLAMGVFLSMTTKIVDRATGEITMGRVPAYSVVVPGALPGPDLPNGRPGPSLSCAVIVKRVDAQTRAKTAINDLLRD